MIHYLTNKDITILEHIIFLCEKSAKQIQFCFNKGKKQFYISPKKNILITFELSSPISFDFPISDLKSFLGKSIKKIDSNDIEVDKERLVLPTPEEIKNFEKEEKILKFDFSFEDLKKINSNKVSKFKYINFLGVDKQFTYRLQNHIWDWWRDENNKFIISKGKINLKFRYVLERYNLSRLLPNNYQVILKKKVIQFTHKHLNYYFLPEVEFHGQGVRSFYFISNTVNDVDLISRYKKLKFI
jgi:hypothetical protein